MRNSKALNTVRRAKPHMARDTLIEQSAIEEIIEQATRISPLQIIRDSKGCRIEQDAVVDYSPRIEPNQLFDYLKSRYKIITERERYSTPVFRDVFDNNTFYVQLDYTRRFGEESIDLYASHNP
jgi:hypothetical protein